VAGNDHLKPADEIAPPERLSISHLLVWTATSAVLLGYQRAMASFSGDQTVVSNLITLCYAPLFGAGLGACLLSVWRLANGGPRFPAQPGHWLLIVGGVAGLISLTFQALVVLALSQVTSYPAFLGIRLVEFVAAGILFGLATASSRGMWRIPFVLGVIEAIAVSALLALSLASFAGFYYDYFYRLELILNVLVTLAVIVVAALDWRRDAQRDYLHWTGVAVRVIYSALVIAIPWLFRWLQPLSE